MSELEYCRECDCATGRAGKGDDSMYLNDIGPYCEDCFAVAESAAIVATSIECERCAKVAEDKYDQPQYQNLCRVAGKHIAADIRKGADA